MCLLCFFVADWKNPPHDSRTPQLSHSAKYTFFQSEIDFLANGQMDLGMVHS